MKTTKYLELAGEMARCGETQRTLAKLLGITPNAIWRRLTGRTEWTINEIDKICEHYQKSYEDLFKKNI